MTLLEQVAAINPRLTASLKDDDSVSFLSMADVDEGGRTNAGHLRSYASVKKGYTPFEVGDVLVAKITPCFQNGKIAQADIATRVGFGSTEFHVVRPDSSKLDSRYLLHMLRLPVIRASGERRMTGSGGQRRVPREFLQTLKVHLPSLKEQRRIAALLDQVDELRAKRRYALTLLEDLRTATLQQFLERSEWDAISFGSIISDLRYGSSAKAADHGSLVMRIPNVRRGALWLDDMKRVPLNPVETEAFALEEGDLLMVRSNGSPDLIGRTAVFNAARTLGTPLASELVVFASYLLRVRLSAQALPAYVEAVLASPPLRRSIRAVARTSAGQYNLNGPAVKNLSIPLPPLTSQQQVVQALEGVAASEAGHRAHLAKLDELFASLQHRAFTGQL